ncbi:MAG: cytochrome c [Deltaproteobacteria bacterium]|nr:MAG: cytochrome c [Deltaproteobacteria bacterium]
MNAIRSLLGATALVMVLPAAALAEDTARGEQLFALCAQCHGDNGGGNPETLAPAIGGLPAWFVTGQLQKFRSGGRGTHFDDISGMRMRPMSMWLRSDEDVANVAAYVSSLAKVNPAPTLAGGSPETGKQKYVLCIACHGMNGEGNQALNAPPLAGGSDWYQLTSLQKFKAGVRGTNPKDTTGMLMRPMSMTLADDQAMLDVIAYIQTLSR